MFTESQVKLFWSHVDVGEIYDCWNWKGCLDHDGYGKSCIGRKVYGAHRLAYEIYNGDFDRKMHVTHACDNPKCCNPNHLRLGTRKDNVRDMISKNRQGWKMGIRKPRKLTQEIADNMRKEFESGSSKRSLSRKYDICCQHVRGVLNGKYWKGAS